MAVAVISSDTATGAEVADTLTGSSLGRDFGQVTNGAYSPLTLQSSNTGAKNIYIRHDAVIDPIISCKLYLAPYSGIYGGADNANDDYALVGSYGSSDTGATANNADGLSRGLHIDMDWQVSTVNQFLYSREASGQKRIYGKSYSGKDGMTQANAFDLHADAMSYWNGSAEIDASAPVTGVIGKSDDTVRGNRGHYKARWYLNTAALDGGVLQYNDVFGYSFTA